MNNNGSGKFAERIEMLSDEDLNASNRNSLNLV